MALPLGVLGAGLGLGGAPAQAAGLESVRRDQSGMAAGAITTLRYVGGLVGVALLRRRRAA